MKLLFVSYFGRFHAAARRGRIKLVTGRVTQMLPCRRCACMCGRRLLAILWTSRTPFHSLRRRRNRQASLKASSSVIGTATVFWIAGYFRDLLAQVQLHDIQQAGFDSVDDCKTHPNQSIVCYLMLLSLRAVLGNSRETSAQH